MIKNYFLIAVRQLTRQKVHTAINILGLAVAMTCVFLIALFVQYEYNYDKHFNHANRIYRIPTVLGSYQTKDSPIPLAHSLYERASEIESVTRLLWNEAPFPYFSPNEENDFQETTSYYADNTFFDVFRTPWLEGDKENALSAPESIVLSESTARKYFGTESALHKTVRFNNMADLKVTGVFQDFPHNSHIHPAILISAITNPLMKDNSAANWEWLYPNATYILLREGASTSRLNSMLKNIFWDVTGYSRETYGADFKMSLQPILDIHLDSHYPGENNGSKSTITTFALIGFVIITIAVINFINLSTASSLRRAKEVGMRKVMGSQRPALVSQFLTESMLLVLIAAAIAVLITSLALPRFNDLIGTDLGLQQIISPVNVGVFLVFVMGLGFVSGLYPAFFLTRQKITTILKGKFVTHAGSVRLRKGLIIAQFAVAFVVLSSTLIIGDQLEFMLHKDLGYDHSDVITIELPGDSVGAERIRRELSDVPGVLAAAKMSESFNNVQGWLVPWYDGAPEQNDFSVTRFHTDSHFKDVAGLQLLEGRFFNEDFRGDSLSYVLNETAVRKLGWKNADAIGKSFGSQQRPGRVIGVVKDFNFRHLLTPVTPFVFFPPGSKKDRYEKGRIAVKLQAGQTPETISRLQTRWSSTIPEWPFKYAYLGDDLDAQYKAETKLNTLTDIFSTLALFISALGLLGLALFSIRQRTREIGIRKILGADVLHLVYITTRDFGVLVAMGLLPGIPITYFAITHWLHAYAFHIDVPLMPFLAAFAITAIVSGLTVTTVAFTASLFNNPVDSLKQE